MSRKALIGLVIVLLVIGTVVALFFRYRAVTVQTLVQDWRGEDYDLAQMATEKIVRMGRIAVEPLLPFLKDKNWEVRWRAATTLGKIGGERVIDPLTETLKLDESKEARSAAVVALQKIGAKEAARRRVQVTNALREALQDKDKEVRRAAISALGLLGTSDAIEPLVESLKDRDWKIREAACEALGSIGSRQVQPNIQQSLIEALKDEDEHVRQAAAQSLGEIGLRTAPEELIGALRDKSANVRISACLSLAKIGDKKAAQALREAKKDKQRWVRWAAKKALERLGV